MEVCSDYQVAQSPHQGVHAWSVAVETGPGKQIPHRLDTGIEFDHALLTGSIVKRLALPQQDRDDDDDPIETMVPMASMRAGACANSALAVECKSSIRRFYSDSVSRANERRTVKRLRPGSRARAH